MIPNFLNDLEEMQKQYKEKSKEEQSKKNRDYLIELLENMVSAYSKKCEFEYKNLMESFTEHAENVKEKERIFSILTELKEEKKNDD